jgi:hypothetical protein
VWWLTLGHFIKIAVIYGSVIGVTLGVCRGLGEPVTVVQVLFRVQEVQRVYLPMHVFIGGLMSFALSLWVNKGEVGRGWRGAELKEGDLQNQYYRWRRRGDGVVMLPSAVLLTAPCCSDSLRGIPSR